MLTDVLRAVILPYNSYLPTFGNQKSGHFYHIIALHVTPCRRPNVIALKPSKKRRSKQINHAHHSASKSMSHSYKHVRLRLIKEISSQFTKKRPGKTLIYVLNITLKKQEQLMAKIVRNGDVPIFGGFESQQ